MQQQKKQELERNGRFFELYDRYKKRRIIKKKKRAKEKVFINFYKNQKKKKKSPYFFEIKKPFSIYTLTHSHKITQSGDSFFINSKIKQGFFFFLFPS